MIKIEGLKNTRQAVNKLGAGEHLWLRGIGDVLIFVRRLSDSTFMICIYSVYRIAKHFTVKGLLVNGNVGVKVAVKLIEKLSSRPCRVVGSNHVDVLASQKELHGSEMEYTEFITMVSGLGIRVQANP